ncbi:MAG: LysR family transcriptional regulator [Eubacteriales bacterium]|nr:LysR family transcriptional regulator [Eubacteriales bacterium]
MNNLLQLKYAVEVEKTGSISKAAENLYMNQPNLSKSIRELEDDLGIAIFDRTAKGVVPTEKGREFLGYARSILSQVAEMEALYRPADEKKLRFDLCAPRASYVSHALTELILSLGADADYAVDYREAGAMRTIKQVANGVDQLGIIRYQTIYESNFFNALTERSLQVEPIWEFSVVALMGVKHPLAQYPSVYETDLAPYAEILYGDGTIPSLPVNLAREIAQAAGAKKTITVYERASQLELLSRMESAYALTSPMPQDVLDRFGLVQKRCAMANNSYRDVLIYRAGYHMTRLDRIFIEKLREAAKKVIPE